MTRFAQAFRTPDLRKKLLFTSGIIVLFRFGSALPAPGISAANVRYCSGLETSRGAAANVYAVLNLFSGNSLLHVTVFALGIMPYITASIIVQLLTQVIPRLQALKDQDRAGQAKITQYTRYLTVMLAVIVSAGYVELARSGNLFPGTDCSAVSHPLIPDPSVLTIVTMMITMVAGTAVIMWMAELITDRGIGNGMSVLIFTSVIAVVFGEFEQIYLTRGIPMTLAAIVVVVAVIAFVVFIEQAQRRIPVQYARRMTGRRVYGGATTYIPVKVNQAGVVPVIFASSLLAIPQLAASLLGNQNSPQGWVAWVDRYLVPSVHVLPVYYLAFFVLIIAFTYFYVSITFNPAEVADNTRKYGGFVPGLRPGPPTAGYLGYVLTRLTAPGAVYLAVIAMLPMVALGMIGIGSQALFSGVSLLIMVGVGLDTVKQVESQLQQHHYEGFLRQVRPARRECHWNLGGSRGIESVVRRVLGAPPSREAEFTEFVEAASARLLRAALVLLDTREEAEDALQLALLRTYRRWDRARQAPEAYSRTVLVNVCRERWRYRARHPEVKGVIADASPQSVVLSFTEAVDRRHVLVRVLRRLPAVQREVLVFRYMLDASVADTAAALDIAEGTVKSAASRGLDQLRILLSAEYEDKKVRRVHPR